MEKRFVIYDLITGRFLDSYIGKPELKVLPNLSFTSMEQAEKYLEQYLKDGYEFLGREFSLTILPRYQPKIIY